MCSEKGWARLSGLKGENCGEGKDGPEWVNRWVSRTAGWVGGRGWPEMDQTGTVTQPQTDINFRTSGSRNGEGRRKGRRVGKAGGSRVKGVVRVRNVSIGEW